MTERNVEFVNFTCSHLQKQHARFDYQIRAKFKIDENSSKPLQGVKGICITGEKGRCLAKHNCGNVIVLNNTYLGASVEPITPKLTKEASPNIQEECKRPANWWKTFRGSLEIDGVKEWDGKPVSDLPYFPNKDEG